MPLRQPRYGTAGRKEIGEAALGALLCALATGLANWAIDLLREKTLKEPNGKGLAPATGSPLKPVDGSPTPLPPADKIEDAEGADKNKDKETQNP